jgi:hypothetical protein
MDHQGLATRISIGYGLDVCVKVPVVILEAIGRHCHDDVFDAACRLERLDTLVNGINLAFEDEEVGFHQNVGIATVDNDGVNGLFAAVQLAQISPARCPVQPLANVAVSAWAASNASSSISSPAREISMAVYLRP